MYPDESSRVVVYWFRRL